jgi:hypothetical protein
MMGSGQLVGSAQRLLQELVADQVASLGHGCEGLGHIGDDAASPFPLTNESCRMTALTPETAT